MIFKTLVECLLKKHHDPDDRLALNALTTLTKEIRRDLTQAFVLSRPLVDRHPSVFWQSRSYFDFLMKLSQLPSLADLPEPGTPADRNDPRGSPADRKDPPDDWEREKEDLQKQLKDVTRQLAACRESLNDYEIQMAGSENTWKSECELRDQRLISSQKDLRDSKRQIDELQLENQRQSDRAQRATAASEALEQKLRQCYEYINPLHTYMQRLYLENWKLIEIVNSLHLERGQILRIGNQLWDDFTKLRNAFEERTETYKTLEAQTTQLQAEGVIVIEDSELKDELMHISTDGKEASYPVVEVQEASGATEALLSTLKEQMVRIEERYGKVDENGLADYVHQLHQKIESCRSDLLAEMAAAVPVHSVTVDEIVARLKDWNRLRQLTNEAELVPHIQKGLRVYNTLTQSIPHLQSERAAQELGHAWKTLREILGSQKIENLNVEEENWFETFVTSFVVSMLQFIRKLENMEPTLPMTRKTDEWYNAFNEKMCTLQTEGMSTNREKRKSETAASASPKKTKLKTVSANYTPVEQLHIIRLENLFLLLYQEHFKLKLQLFKEIPLTRDERNKVNRKLEILNEKSLRPSSLMKIYEKYIEFDLNAAIGNTVEDIIEVDSFLEACMKNTTNYLENLVKSK